MFNSFISKIEPKIVKVALNHADWVQDMQEELNEFDCKKVWQLAVGSYSRRCICGWYEMGIPIIR